MGRLDLRKLRYLLQQKRKGASSAQIAQRLGVTKRRVNQVWKQYQEEGERFELRRPGRKPKPVEMQELELVANAYATYKVGALGLEKALRRDGHKIAHNRIHHMLKEIRVAEPDPKKQKRRKWVRWERDHSNDMWHLDWTQLSDETWLLAIQDDASRYVLDFCVAQTLTADASIELVQKAIEVYGKPAQVLTDKGATFHTMHQLGKKPAKSRFTRFLEEQGIKHITARVNHPQTNGKIERLFGTIKKASNQHFQGDIEQTFHWYNQVRPHMSLNYERAETPLEAYHRKLRPETVLENTSTWFWK